MPSGHSFDQLTTILKRVAQRLGLETKLLESSLRQHWHEIAGDQIAAHTRPDQIRFKKLYVIVESSVWAQHMTFLKPGLIEKINATSASPLISDIVLRVGEVDRLAGVSEKRREGLPEQPSPSPESVEHAAVHARHLKDPDLRAHLTMVMANALSATKPSSTPGSVGRRLISASENRNRRDP